MFDRPDPRPKRALLIRYLRDVRAAGIEPLGELLDQPGEGVEELFAEADRFDPDKPGPNLTPREVASMRNDYRRDPYMTPLERRESLRWLAANWPTGGLGKAAG